MLALAVMAALALGACQDAREPRFPLREPLVSPTASDTLVIGFVGTLSGPDSWRGEDAFEGADVGVQALNRARPEGLPPYELRPLDDGGSAPVATQLVGQLAALGSTVGVVYAGPPEGLPPAEAALARAGIPAVLCYGDLGADLARPHLFQTSPPYAWQARRLASYLLRDRRYETVGAVVERSPAGEAARDALESAVEAGGGRFKAADLRSLRRAAPALAALRRFGAEAVAVHGAPGTVARVLETLRRMGAAYRTTAEARIASAPRRRAPRRLPWRPQPAAFDLAIGPRGADARRGTVAADSYARGAHYLPIPSMSDFRRAFGAWWDSEPVGWERRAFDAVRMIGWAAQRAEQDDDLAEVLEGLSGVRFSGLPVSFAAGDHVSVNARTVGLWVVPRRGIRVRERARGADFASFPWVPLARSFASGRRVTRVLPPDRTALFRPRPRGRPAPPAYRRMRFGVTTPRSDPVH